MNRSTLSCFHGNISIIFGNLGKMYGWLQLTKMVQLLQVVRVIKSGK